MVEDQGYWRDLSLILSINEMEQRKVSIYLLQKLITKGTNASNDMTNFPRLLHRNGKEKKEWIANLSIHLLLQEF